MLVTAYLEPNKGDLEVHLVDEDDNRVDDEGVDRQTPEGVEHGSVRRRDAGSLPLGTS